MNCILFRKSTNTNSFGLRGYWYTDIETGQCYSFASSHDYVTIPQHATEQRLRSNSFELHRKEPLVLSHKQLKDLLKQASTFKETTA